MKNSYFAAFMPKKRPGFDAEDFFSNGHKYFLPHVSIDCVVFGFHNNMLKVLLLQWKDSRRWSLPGGFIYRDEHIDQAAVRILKSRTGLRNIFLRQFYAFGAPRREKGKHGLKNLAGNGSGGWLTERFVTIGYWSIVDFSEVKPAPDEFSLTCEWCDIHDVPTLILDHNHILDEALNSLRRDVNDYPIGKNLLPEKFTMPELQRLYETVLGKKLDRRNFQKKMLSFGILRRLTERKTGVAHKAPYLYRFDEKRYQRALDTGLKFGL